MTSIESGPSWVERLNPRHWTLVWKLVIVGLVPALLALALGVLRIADQAGSAADLGRSGRLLDARNEIVAAATALRLERDQATLFAASNGNGDRAALDSSRQRSDEALTTMRGGLTAATADFEPATVAALQRTQDSLDLVTSLRQTVTATPSVPYDQVVNRYTNVIGTIDVLDRAILRQQRTQATAGLADASSAVTSALEQLSIQHAVLAGAIRAGKPLPSDPAVVNAATAQLVNSYRDYQAALTPEQLATFGNLPDTSATSRMDQLRSAILTAPFQLNPLAKDWDSAYDQARESTDRSAGLISTELSATAAAAAQRASNLAGINSVILMLGLLVGITIAVLVARSLIRSLRLLRSSALDVAERRLPQAVESMRAGEAPDVAVEPVPIGTRDEVGQVARAFDAVHGQAVRLAAEQAALQANVSSMFINLSRRSQALVERQLQLIEALESNEQDADQLSNLFQLDHLATRMRRNSENLLVLAGTDLAKRNMAPVPVVDVLRAAVSEVEQYQRVVVQAPPAASIAGRAGSDLVHLLAELLDNATAFSPPESQVVMSTTRSPDGAIVIEISDRGVGMADDELADANMRLVGPAGVDVSASRRMGLFVVGRLAARHGVGVRLASTAAGPGSGLTASVSVPPTLIPTGVPADAPRPMGAPMPAGVPAQGRPAEARPRPDANGARPTPLSALVTGADAPGSTPTAARDASAAGGQNSLYAGKPPVNGTTAHGLPSRRPGSSLRPEGPPPTEAPPGGFFDDGGRAEGGPRPPGEQARLDQEAAARRDRERMAGGAGLAAVPPLTARPSQPDDDERSVSDDERSGSEGPRLTKDLAGSPTGSPRTGDGTAGPETARIDTSDTRGVEGRGPDGRQAARGAEGSKPEGRGPDASGPEARGSDTRDADAGRTGGPKTEGGQDAAGRPGAAGLGLAAAGGAAAAAGMAGRPEPTPGRDGSSDPRLAARSGDASPSGPTPPGSTPAGGTPSRGLPFGATAGGYPSGTTQSGEFPAGGGRSGAGNPAAFLSGASPSDRFPVGGGRSGAGDTGEFPPGPAPSGEFPAGGGRPGAGHTGEFPAGPAPSGEFPAGGGRPGAGHTGEFPAGPAPAGEFTAGGGRPGAGHTGEFPSRAAGVSGAGQPGSTPSDADRPSAGRSDTASSGAGQPGTAAEWSNDPARGGPGASGGAGSGPSGAQGFAGDQAVARGTDPQSTGGHLPVRGQGVQSTGGHAPTWSGGDRANDAWRTGSTGTRPGDTGGYPVRSYADTPGDDVITPATGAEPLPRRNAGTPGPGPRAGDPGQSGQYRTDQQARPPEQYRSVSGTGGFPPAPQSGPPAPSPSRRPAPDPADELFAPRVPSLDPDGELPGHDPNASAFDLGETTPIFEEIASAWFRSNRPVPVSWESDTGSHPVVPQDTPAAEDTDPNGVARSGASRTGDGWGDTRSPVGTPADGWSSVGRPAPGPADILADAGVDAPPSARPAPSAAPPSGVPSPSAPAAAGPPPAYPLGATGRPAYDPADAPAAPAPRQPEPTPADFSTEADEGWLAASGAVADRPDELTAAGLPKRRPRARLIPGSAGSAVLAPAVTAARSAESIRGRLASYQQGVRQGRETRLRGQGDDHTAPPAAPGADHDEESS